VGAQYTFISFSWRRLERAVIVVALGANLPSQAGPPRETMLSALDALTAFGIRIAAVSPFYASRAWPDPGDPEFVNAVAVVDTELSPVALMTKLHEVETSFGRKRSKKNAPRPLDLDLIDYDGRVEHGPPVLPHPRMRDRAFVLAPLADVAPGWRHPVSGESVEQLLVAADRSGTRRADR
jgi:2-amino-4-hydroxy-6-hydroxymethyldihydropteridine diphosphokinase